MKRIMMSVVLVILVAGVQNVLAQPFRQGPPPGGMKWDRVLDLTEEQQGQIQDMRLNFRKEMIPLEARMDDLRAKLKLNIIDDNFDQKKMNEIISEQNKLRSEMQMKRIMHLRAVRELLTPDQRKKFDLHILSQRGFGKGMDGNKCKGGKGMRKRFGHGF